jgi:hypothetical protein
VKIVGDAINAIGRVQIHNEYAYCGNSMPLIRKQQRRKLSDKTAVPATANTS